MPRVTAAIPTYNRARYVGEAIESVLAQTHPSFELIVVDDGSTDSTPAILERLACNDPRLRVVTLSRPFGHQTALTTDGSDKILNGRLDWVYEEEIYGRGKNRAYWWSPDSTSIAFLRLDDGPVPTRPESAR